MTSEASTVEEYLSGLPEDRREALSAVRQAILGSVQPGFEEGMQYGMIGYYVPHSLYPPGYHCNPKEPLNFIGLGNQKNHMGLYLFCLYMNEELLAELRSEYAVAGKKLDMGKACLRFKKLSDLHLGAITDIIKKISVDEFVGRYQAVLTQNKKR